ncbi:MAG: ABC transporter ATP-binding protein [Firmicutes bacterium]|nr:ABC transporter ATP-binding protein [Bacillota bacterium]
MEPLLKVKNLKTYFHTDEGVIRAVDGVDFTLDYRSVVGIVGESGSGKSVTSLSILRLVPPPGKIMDGEILLEGNDLLKLKEYQMRNIRGSKISMIFQDPMTALNPVITIGEQVSEALLAHQDITKEGAGKRAVKLLETVKIPDAGKRFYDYPHQFSGGMRQRVMIAMALACNPAVLIADEPTTALDVSIQAQILELMRSVLKEFGTSIILITHNLGIVAEICNHVYVMYGGIFVEWGKILEIFNEPKHPYTAGLLASIPKIDEEGKESLTSIEGSPPVVTEPVVGCIFKDRCPYVMDVCKAESPPVVRLNEGHFVRCYKVYVKT